MDQLRRRLHHGGWQHGQGSIEYVGVVLVVVALATVLLMAAPAVGPKVACALGQAIGQSGGCTESTETVTTNESARSADDDRGAPSPRHDDQSGHPSQPDLESTATPGALQDDYSGAVFATAAWNDSAPVAAAPAAFAAAARSSGDPAVAPDVENDQLRRILERIYVRPGTQNPVGDGKVATALINEIETGKQTNGKWHAVAASDRLGSLIDLLEADRKPNNPLSLSPGDRAVALNEAGEIWEALNKPMDKGNPLYTELTNNETARQNIAAVERKMLEAPSMKSITGTEFKTNSKGRPVPKSRVATGKVLGGVGALGYVGSVYDIFTMYRLFTDDDYFEYYYNNMFNTYCQNHYCRNGVPEA